MKKRIIVIALCAMLLFTSTACGGGDGGDGSKISLTFWHLLTGPDGATMRGLIAEFNNEHQGEIEILETPNNATAHYTNLSSLVPLNKGPDIALIHSYLVPEYAYNDLIQPIDGHIEMAETEINPEDYIENVFNSLYFDGSLYGIPLDVHMLVMFYNKNLLGSNAVPTNRQELINVAKAVQNANSGVWGLPLSTTWPSEWLYTTALYQNGGSEVTSDGYPAFNTSAGLTALNNVVDLIHVEGLSQTDLVVDDDLQLFKQGKALFHMQGSWMLESIKEVGFEFGTLPVSNFFTTGTGGTSGQIAARSHVFTAPVKRGGEAKKPAIIKFIKWMNEHSATWAPVGQVPAYNAARETEEYLALPYHAGFGLPENFRLSAASPFVSSGYNPVFSRVTTAMSSDQGGKTRQQLLTEAETEARQLVNEIKS